MAIDGTCETCRYWKVPLITPMGICGKSTMLDGKMSTFVRNGYVWTDKDFGCVQYEEVQYEVPPLPQRDR